LRPNAAFSRNQTVLLQRRAAVASASTEHTATTERGPPEHPKTCAQNAHEFRRKGLIALTVLSQQRSAWNRADKLQYEILPAGQPHEAVLRKSFWAVQILRAAHSR